MFEKMLAKVREALTVPDQKEIIDWFLDQGCSIIPIVLGGKHPPIKWKKYQSERASKEQVYRWRFIEGYDLAVVLGAVSGNMVVMDMDDPKLYHQAFGRGTEHRTLVVMTRKMGRDRKRHVWLRAAHSVATRHLAGMDIQGEGAYVKIPPSAGYDIELWPVNEIEKWDGDFDAEIEELLTKKLKMKFISEIVDVRLLSKPAPIGMRHARMIRYITWLRLCKVPKKEAIEKVLEWNQACEDSKDDTYVEYQVNYLYERTKPYQFKFNMAPHKIYSKEVMDKARKTLKDKNPFKILLKALHQVHSGDDELAMLTWISLISSWMGKIKIKINLYSIGESGTGKSHLKVSILEMMPENLHYTFSSTSPLAFFYYVKKYGEDSLDKKLIYIDEVTGSKDTVPVLKHLTGQTAITPRHLSVYDAKLLDMKINGRRSVWFTSVRTLDDEQIQNRFVAVNPDDSLAQDVDVNLLQTDIYIEGKTVDNDILDLMGAITQVIIDETEELDVVFPFYIYFPLLNQRRLFPVFITTINVITRIMHSQREKKGGRLLATIEDFELARNIWRKLERTITHRVAGKPMLVLDILGYEPETAMTFDEIAAKLDVSVSTAERHCEELMNHGLINQKRRDVMTAGRPPLEVWRVKVPSTLDIELVTTREGLVKRLKEYSSHTNTKQFEYSNVRSKGGAGDDNSHDIVNVELLKWLEEEEKT